MRNFHRSLQTRNPPARALPSGCGRRLRCSGKSDLWRARRGSRAVGALRPFPRLCRSEGRRRLPVENRRRKILQRGAYLSPFSPRRRSWKTSPRKQPRSSARRYFHHGGRTRPDRIDQRFRLVPVGSKLRCEKPEIAFRKFILIHREQCPVQIKQYRLDHLCSCPAFLL